MIWYDTTYSWLYLWPYLWFSFIVMFTTMVMIVTMVAIGSLLTIESTDVRDRQPQVCEGWLESVTVAGTWQQCSTWFMWMTLFQSINSNPMTGWIKTWLMEFFAHHSLFGFVVINWRGGQTASHAIWGLGTTPRSRDQRSPSATNCSEPQRFGNLRCPVLQ